VLMVAFHFPPEGGSGTQRTLKFARYLPRFGWDVEVLTVRLEVYDVLDYSLLKELPASVQVHRAWCIDPAKHLSIRGRHPGFFNFLDRYAYWFPAGLWRGLRLLRQRHFDVIYSTSPTRTAHLIAGALSYFSRLPWVCDFRDPWLDGDGREAIAPMRGARLYFKILTVLERSVVRMARCIIANTQPSLEDLVSRFGQPDKVLLLPNGFDEEDFTGIAPAPRAAGCELTLLHTGEVYPKLRDPRPLLEAVEMLLRENAIGPRDLRVRFVGPGAGLDCDEFRAWLADRAVGKLVSIEPRLSHRECIAQTLSADLLLLLQCSPLANGQIPAKAFEYLRTGRPILALAPPDSATARLVHSCNAGWVADVRDPKMLRDCVLQALARHKTDALPSDFSRGRDFERSNLARALGKILERVAFSSALSPVGAGETSDLSAGRDRQ